MTVLDSSERPEPGRVNTSADLAHQLRMLKMWAGDPSLRELAKRTGIPASTLSDALNEAKPLPRLEVLRALLDQLLPSPEAATEWELAWRRARTADLAARETPADGPAAVPRQLPGDIGTFVGRADLLNRLDLLLDPENRPPAAVLTAITGSGGVGKTALAVHWGHRVAGRFPDGQLYVDLAGFGPGKPRQPAEVLGLFLRGLGVAPADIPLGLDERVARYRSLVAGRRLLVVLDNASSPEQVRPLLPTGRDSFAVITTRNAFTGLRARDGAVRIYVDRLGREEALELLGSLVGDRVPADRAAAVSFVELCSRLPLTLRIAAQHAIDRPSAPLAELVSTLRSRGLDFFDGADSGGEGGEQAHDPYSNVRAVFSWSLAALPIEAVRLFTLLGLHPGRHVDAHTAAALADVPYDEAEHLLATLLRVHLIDEAGGERFAMHDLLRSYAAELASTLDADTVDAARERLADCYVHTLVHAKDTAHPWDAGDRKDLPGSPAYARRFADAAEAGAWLDEELDNLVAMAAHTASHNRPRHAQAFSSLLWRRLYLRSRHDEGLAVHRHAFEVAETYGNDGDAGAAAFRIGDVWWRIGEYGHALKWFGKARERKERAGDSRGLAHALNGLGTVYLLTERYAEALEAYQRCRELAALVGSTDTEAVAAHNLGEVHTRLSEWDAAAERYGEAMAIAEAGDLRDYLAGSLAGHATALVHLGRHAEAWAELRRALDLALELDSAGLQAEVLLGMGRALAARGQRAEAEGHLRRALRMFTDLGNAAGVAEAGAALAGL